MQCSNSRFDFIPDSLELIYYIFERKSYVTVRAECVNSPVFADVIATVFIFGTRIQCRKDTTVTKIPRGHNADDYI